MDTTAFLGQMGLGIPLLMAAIGSSMGVRAAGTSAAGAWGKEAKAGKRLNFSYVILTGMPLSQTVYAFILMFVGLKATVNTNLAFTAEHAGAICAIGVACGMAEMFSAWVQGIIGGAACRALSEGEGKGLIFMIIAMGMAETVGIFGLIFSLLVLPTATGA